MKRSDKLLLIPVVLGTMHGCGTGLLSDTVGEGVIEYAMSFPDYDPNGIMAGMLPERTTLTFTEDKQVAELSAGMGIFRTSMITNDEAEAMDYHLSLMGKKIVAHMLPRDLDLFAPKRLEPLGLDDVPGTHRVTNRERFAV